MGEEGRRGRERNGGGDLEEGRADGAGSGDRPTGGEGARKGRVGAEGRGAGGASRGGGGRREGEAGAWGLRPLPLRPGGVLVCGAVWPVLWEVVCWFRGALLRASRRAVENRKHTHTKLLILAMTRGSHQPEITRRWKPPGSAPRALEGSAARASGRWKERVREPRRRGAGGPRPHLRDAQRGGGGPGARRKPPSLGSTVCSVFSLGRTAALEASSGP